MVAERHMIEERRRRVREDRAWLSPPDPSINLNTASKVQHQGTATWFFEENIFMEWKPRRPRPCCGSTENVRHSAPCLLSDLDYFGLTAGSGKSILWSVVICHVRPRGTYTAD